MVKKKTTNPAKTKKAKKTVTKSKKQSKIKQKKSKEEDLSGDEMGIVVIENSLDVDKKAELEEKRAYLEEAKSQEASD